MRYIGSFILPFALLASEISLTGALRNDAMVTSRREPAAYSDKLHEFNNILETGIVLEAENEDWKYYGDARAYFYEGSSVGSTSGNGRSEDVKLMRSFLRYTSGIGTTTLGKAFVNVGNGGLFNPFEIRKLVTFSDLSYTREGFLLASQTVNWQDTSELLVYAGSPNPFNYDPFWGISPGFHFSGMQGGLVVSHARADHNNAGIFLKGDYGAGFHGSWNTVLSDEGNYRYNEAVAGMDYSVNAQWFFDAGGYYNQSGADNPAEYETSETAYLSAEYYAFFSANYIPDEFLQMGVMAFINATDGSTLLLPSVTTFLSTGLSATLLFVLPTATGQTEFSQDLYGAATTLVRVEGKF